MAIAAQPNTFNSKCSYAIEVKTIFKKLLSITWTVLCQQLTEPREQMVPGFLTKFDTVSMCRPLSTGGLIGLCFMIGQLVARNQCVIR